MLSLFSQKDFLEERRVKKCLVQNQQDFLQTRTGFIRHSIDLAISPSQGLTEGWDLPELKVESGELDLPQTRKQDL